LSTVFNVFFLAQIGLGYKTDASNDALRSKRKRQEINKMQTRQGKERKMMTQKPESAFEKRSASRVVDTLRAKPWQRVLDRNTARCRFGSRKYEFHEPLREQSEVEFRLLGLPLLLL
jgi:hypothetical protein